jgi:RNA polymerase sigma-70 factor (family 1)
MSKGTISTDTVLIGRLRKGDQKAMAELYDMYWKPLFISSYNLLKDKEICEDIIQEVFIDIWKNRERLVIKISLKSYLYACIRYKVFNEFRKNTRGFKVELFEGISQRFQQTTPETEIMHKELISQVNLIVDTMPQKCREVYKLSREELLSHKEIASNLNISTKTVENHITKALKILRASLGVVLSIELFILIF